MRIKGALEIIILAFAQAAVIAHSAFQGIILPGTYFPHLGEVWQM